MSQGEVITDPREGTFEALHTIDGETMRGVTGAWKFEHVGMGEHMFIHTANGNAVPASSVIEAVRKVLQ